MFTSRLEENEKNYPRKLLRRKKWQSLNGVWDFRFDHEQKFNQPHEIDVWPLTINVPFACECPASGIGDNSYHQRVWYRRSFDFYKTDTRVLLHFGAVDYLARVWLNGQFLGSHEGGHTPFSFDITDALKPGGEQILVVCADDDPLDLTKPRGKQDWLPNPHSIWYPRTTGIWQTVWIEEVSQNYIERLRCTPLLERWEVSVEAFINGVESSELQLEVKLKCGPKLLARDVYDVVNKEVHRKIAMSDPGIDDYRNELLWSPEKPTLLDIELKLIDGDRIVDHVHSYTALRSVAMSRDRFLLNGRPYYLRLVLDQGYWPDTYMTPPSAEAIQKDIQLTKAAGFNGVRKHQKVEDPDYFYWADVMGLMVWGEMPSAYRFTHESVERLTREWIDVIDRDMSHPSIVVWVPFNESWGVPDLAEKTPHQHCVQTLYHLTKTLDPTRPCIGNDGWESTATDILGIHDYDAQPQRLLKKYSSGPSIEDILNRYRPGGRVITVEGFPHGGQPVMLTEFGGISFVDQPQNNSWGYSTSQNADDFRERYEKLMAAVHKIEIFAGFCYTQLTDTFQETNGLFRADRTPKFSINSMARATRGVDDIRGELTSTPKPPPLPPPEIDA